MIAQVLHGATVQYTVDGNAAVIDRHPQGDGLGGGEAWYADPSRAPTFSEPTNPALDVSWTAS